VTARGEPPRLRCHRERQEPAIAIDANAALKLGLRWLSPAGRSGRGGYLVALIIVILIGIVIVRGVDATLGKSFGTIAVALFVWLGICLTGRRLHDTGRSAWCLLAFVVPVIGALWLVWVAFFQRGTQGDNKFGPDPQQRAADYLTVA
jgi:uncharacterized membrane protein YhaH (DUF805 family)